MDHRATDPIDIIMPAYNAERWIAEAVRSVLALPGVRSLTITDDESVVPLTAENAGAGGDPRVTVLRRPNGGEAAARNTAIEHLLARTDPADDARSWVMFFDADDVLLPTCLEAIGRAEAEGAAACVGSREGFITGGEAWRIDPPEDLRDTAFATPDEAFRYQSVFASTGMTVRRSVLRAGERWDEVIHTCPDIELLHRFATHGPVWVSTSLMLRYRQHTDGSSLSGFKHFPRRIRGFVRTVDLHRTPANDHLFRHQAGWLLKEASRHSGDRGSFQALLDLHQRCGWPVRPKVRLRGQVRSLLGSMK